MRLFVASKLKDSPWDDFLIFDPTSHKKAVLTASVCVFYFTIMDQRVLTETIQSEISLSLNFPENKKTDA